MSALRMLLHYDDGGGDDVYGQLEEVPCELVEVVLVAAAVGGGDDDDECDDGWSCCCLLLASELRTNCPCNCETP